MATLAFSLAGQFAGGLVGGPVGATIGRALGALAGSAVDNALFGDQQNQSAAGQDLRLQGSSNGGAIPRIYGWSRVSGNIIWATELERIEAQSSGAKATSPNDGSGENITANFAVALCEGEVSHIGRIWADGELLDTEGLATRFYAGTEDQLADSLIVAKQGADHAPAYRGTCYLVFERLPLAQFGNRIPNISVELCRTAGDLEPSIRAMTVIPGASEFGYDPTPRVRILGHGSIEAENTHILGRSSDWSISIDELQGLCPNLEHVALVVAWFGDDLRCGNCKVQPRVENASRQIKGTQWVVNGLTRAEVPVVSYHDGGPAYGGTPSDTAVLAAIADLKSRGIKVTLYPIILMDVAEGNSLPDPNSLSVGQPAYPWRGRLTCDPAPQQAGSPDNSGAIDAQIDAFVGASAVGHFTPGSDTINYSGPADWGYRRMFLHYANLAQLAGGVDAFLIGSEMRGMSTLRRNLTAFPFVETLVDLAADVRTIVGAETNVTYAADWSEYSGFQPPDAPGDKLFHLDPLWASPAIDAIGIDNYMPLSDWREGTDHADAALASSSHDLGYLQANIAGGEGYDWFYASPADRVAGNRTPIVDGAYGEHWVWRYKDLENWWNNQHYNRVGGVRDALASNWVPQSKPFWFTELGCGAVDKGSNLPNAFTDPKSSENTSPHFSTGAPDPVQQRQHLRAHHLWWQPDSVGFVEANNPVSAQYPGRMVDPDRLYLWTWDARPYPAFPNLGDVWSDGANHATGHWLTGRLGATGAGELISAVAQDFDVAVSAEISGDIQVQGLQVGNITTARNALGAVIDAADYSILDKADGLNASRIGEAVVASVAIDDRVDAGAEITTRKKPDATASTGQLGFSYSDRLQSYATSTVTAVALEGDAVVAANSGLVLGGEGARTAAENALSRANTNDDTLEFGLPLSWLHLEAGDVVDVEGQPNGPFVIAELRDSLFRRVVARAIPPQMKFAVHEQSSALASGTVLMGGSPLVVAAHLPAKSDGVGSTRVFAGALAQPWPGDVVIEETISGIVLTRLSDPAVIGIVTAPIQPGSIQLWDRQTQLMVELFSGHLSTASSEAVLAGLNRLAVQCDDGNWEIIGFTGAELVTASNYRLSGLLRGLEGTGETSSPISIGNQIMLLDDRAIARDISPEVLGSAISATVFAGAHDSEGAVISIATSLDPALPLSPVHLKAAKDYVSGDIAISWVRRCRVNGNSWALMEVPLEPAPEAYRVQILSGGALVRSFQTTTPSVTYSAADQVSDFGGAPANFEINVTQVSPTLGAGHQTSGVFN